MNKTTKLSVACVAASIYGVVAIGEARDTYYLKSSPSGSDRWVAFTNAAWWVKSDGVTFAGSSGDTLPANADYVVRGGYQLCTFNSNKAPSPIFAGYSLKIGDNGDSSNGTLNDYAAGNCNADYGTNGGLVLERGAYVFNNGHNAKFKVSGKTTVTANGSAFRIYNVQNYTNQTVTWQGDLYGDAGTKLQIGRKDLARGTAGDEYFKFAFSGSTANFLGSLSVQAPPSSEKAPNFKVHLSVGGTFGGSIDMGTNTVLTTPCNALTLPTLTLADGVTLGIDASSASACSSFVVTESFQMEGSVNVSVPYSTLDGDPAAIEWTLLDVPEGTYLDENKFSLVNPQGSFSLSVDSGNGHEYLKLSRRNTFYLRFDLNNSANSAYKWQGFTNAYLWVMSDGTTSAGNQGEAPPTDADYVVKNGYSLFTFNSNANPDPVFGGHSLRIGDLATGQNGTLRDYAAKDCNADYGDRGGLILERGNYIFQNNDNVNFKVFGKTTVTATGTPFQIHNNSGYRNQIVAWHGDLHGESGTVLQIGGMNARTDTADDFFKFSFLGDTSDFRGTISVVQPTPGVGTTPEDFRVNLNVGGTFGGTISMGEYTILASTNATSLSAAGLSLADGATLQVVATSPMAHSSFEARESFSASGKTFVSVPLAAFAGAPASANIDILAVPLGTNLSVADFELVNSLGGGIGKYRLAVEADYSCEYLRLKKSDGLVITFK